MPRFRTLRPPLVAVATLPVVLVLGSALVGYEPIGADPDLLYRPLKSELARALRAGTLPFWSDRLGLGVPLAAESHVAAFYPPNWVAYRLLPVVVAYRAVFVLHGVATAIATFFYARRLGQSGEGAALSAIAFSLSGFAASHAGHEPLFIALPYLPLCVMLGEQYAERGRMSTLALLAIAWGCQLTVGHFQLQAWTGGLTLLVGSYRIVGDRWPRIRLVGLAAAMAWGLAVAAPQLALTWELTSFGRFARPFDQLATYAFPPQHWAQPAMPWVFLPWASGDASRYWGPMATSAVESTFYVGAIPLILAILGAGSAGRSLRPWIAIVAASLLVASMPHWWRTGYWVLTRFPVLGAFRCPGRYTVAASLGLALLAGRGLDRILAHQRCRIALSFAVLLGVGSLAWCWLLLDMTVLGSALGKTAIAVRFGVAASCWAVGLGMVLAVRSNGLRSCLLLIATAFELGVLYHLGPVRWGWLPDLPSASPVLSRLAREPRVQRVAGPLEDLPVRAGATVAFPYLGIAAPSPNYLLEPSRSAFGAELGPTSAWLRRYGVSHAILPPGQEAAGTVVLADIPDPALDRIVGREPGPTARASWRIVRLPGTWPEARVALRRIRVEDWPTQYRWLLASDDAQAISYQAAEEPEPHRAAAATSARVVRWDGREAIVEHDGACDLLINRTYYPGWTARVNGGRSSPVLRADGGLQAVALEGMGTSRVEFTYRPTRLIAAVILSMSAIATALLVVTFFGRRDRLKP